MTSSKDFLIKFFAGLFVIGGIVLATYLIFTIGKSKGIAQQKFQVTVLYKNVGGLIEGAPILLSGVHVGTVSSIDFLEEQYKGRRVRVVMSLFSKYKKQLNTNAEFSINTEGILGEKIVEIDLFEDGQKVDLSQPIIGEDPIDVQDLALVFAQAAESFTQTAEQLSKIDISQLSSIMEQTALSLSRTSQGITETLKELSDISKKAKRVIDRIEQKIIENSLFKVF